MGKREGRKERRKEEGKEGRKGKEGEEEKERREGGNDSNTRLASIKYKYIKTKKVELLIHAQPLLATAGEWTIWTVMEETCALPKIFSTTN